MTKQKTWFPVDFPFNQRAIEIGSARASPARRGHVGWTLNRIIIIITIITIIIIIMIMSHES